MIDLLLLTSIPSTEVVAGGAGGVLGAGLAWLALAKVASSYQKQVTARIEALEEASKECNADRSAIHRQFHEFQMGILKEAVSLMNKQAQSLTEMSKKT